MCRTLMPWESGTVPHHVPTAFKHLSTAVASGETMIPLESSGQKYPIHHSAWLSTWDCTILRELVWNELPENLRMGFNHKTRKLNFSCKSPMTSKSWKAVQRADGPDADKGTGRRLRLGRKVHRKNKPHPQLLEQISCTSGVSNTWA